MTYRIGGQTLHVINKREYMDELIMLCKTTENKLPPCIIMEREMIPDEFRSTMTAIYDGVEIPIFEKGGIIC